MESTDEQKYIFVISFFFISVCEWNCIINNQVLATSKYPISQYSPIFLPAKIHYVSIFVWDISGVNFEVSLAAYMRWLPTPNLSRDWRPYIPQPYTES